MFEIQQLDHLVLRARDSRTLVDFYCEVLGMKVERTVESVGLVQLRAALDARHDGERERWCGALAPLAQIDGGSHPDVPHWWDGSLTFLIRLVLFALACLVIVTLGSWVLDALSY